MGEVIDLERYRRARRCKPGAANRRGRAKRPAPPAAPCDGPRAPDPSPGTTAGEPAPKRDEPDSKS